MIKLRLWIKCKTHSHKSIANNKKIKPLFNSIKVCKVNKTHNKVKMIKQIKKITINNQKVPFSKLHKKMKTINNRVEGYLTIHSKTKIHNNNQILC